ncbi:TetR/AcrR family transcriptional regulator [Actinocorallia populi]|uniref:TetR/AcrR family transcriptional regulator n=1 Tax=Actinocorallia populi TaxID=2079200 RepID=UPI000D088D8C|nr:TetR/AcrR family transcriptional regulator [Actinocorallia populi]
MLDEITREESPEHHPTTARILRAALEEFLDKGIRRAKLEEIARRAGVSRVTVHRRYPGKQDLVTAVLIEEARDLYARGRVVARAEKTLPDKIAAAFVFIFDYARHGRLKPLLLSDPGPFLPAFTTRGEPLIVLLRAYYLELMRDAGVHHPAMEVSADVLARTVVSYCLSPSAVVDLRDPANAADFARHHLAPILQTGP